MTEPHPLVLVVEDQPEMLDFLRELLTADGYRTLCARTLIDGVRQFTTEHPDAVLLDRGLPDGDGLDLVGRVREWSSVPVLVVSSRGREEEKVAALDAGADDYLGKPFGMNELLARLRAALRHSRAAALPEKPVVEIGGVRMDIARHEATVDGRPVMLTPTEWRFIACLARHRGNVVPYARILHDVWGPNATERNHYVRVYMGALRKKLEPDPSRPRLLLSEHGIGCRLADSVAPGESR